MRIGRRFSSALPAAPYPGRTPEMPPGTPACRGLQNPSPPTLDLIMQSFSIAGAREPENQPSVQILAVRAGDAFQL